MGCLWTWFLLRCPARALHAMLFLMSTSATAAHVYQCRHLIRNRWMAKLTAVQHSFDIG